MPLFIHQSGRSIAQSPITPLGRALHHHCPAHFPDRPTQFQLETQQYRPQSPHPANGSTEDRETELCLLHTHFTYDMMGFLDNILETIDFYLPTKHRPVILMGDMNVTPDAHEFSHLQDAGFIDLWQHFQPYTDGFSYPAVHPIQRIDYMWANEQAASLVTKVEQWAVKPDETGIHCSDHLGLIATLRI